MLILEKIDVNALFQKATGPSSCEDGTSTLLKDFGYITLEKCQTNCIGLEECTDITWAPGDQRCFAFDGCKNPKVHGGWQHFSLKGNFKTLKHYNLIRAEIIDGLLNINL